MARELTGILNVEATKATKKASKKKTTPALEVKGEVKGAEVVELTSAELLKKEIKKAQTRPTMEDTHIRSTFLLRRDLQERLDELAQTQPRGFKTKFLNIAIEELLNQFES